MIEAASVAPLVETDEVQEFPRAEGGWVPMAAVADPLPAFKVMRKAVTSAEQFPRGERWMLRRPRAALVLAVLGCPVLVQGVQALPSFGTHGREVAFTEWARELPI
jgi:hypothetical protein